MRGKNVLQAGQGLKHRFEKLLPDAQGEEMHRARLLLVAGLIIITIGGGFLVTQLAFSAFLGLLTPWTDLLMDGAFLLIGGLTVWLVQSKHIRLAAWTVLGCVLIAAVAQLYLEGQPYADVAGTLALFIVIALAMVLLDRRSAWLTFFVTAAIFVGMHLLWLGGYLPPPINRDLPGQALFSTLAWLTAGTIVVIVIDSTMSALRGQAQTLRQWVDELAQAERKIQHLLDQQVAVNQLTLALGETLDLENVYHTIYQHVQALVDAWAFVISIYDDATEQIQAAYAVHKGTVVDVSGFPSIPLSGPGQGPQSQVIHTGQPLYVPDYRKAMETSRTEYTVEENGTIHPGPPPEDQDYAQSAFYVPMKIAGQVIGVMQLQSNQLDNYDPGDVNLLAGMANVAAVAIQNARLYDAAQQELAERVRIEEQLQRSNLALEAERATLERRVVERTADLRRTNAELTRAVRAKDEFLATMSHELRTPLNAILGKAETLRDEIFGPLNETQDASLLTIEESGRHLLALINDILDVAKIESDKLGLNIGPVSVPGICEASLRMIKQAAQEKRIQILSQLDSDVTAVPIQADGRRLKQILVNLLSNAVKFTPSGGQVGLEVRGDAQNAILHFTVWDTGIGIAQEDIGRLFQPFVQLDSRLSRQYTGTGLGLTLVARLTKMHGGGVTLESAVGKGSHFTVSLPWKPTPARTPEAREQVPPAEHISPIVPPLAQQAQGKILILLVEDNEESVNTFVPYLEAQGCRVIVVRDGAATVQHARQARPDLILMDIQMPGIDGLETTRRLKADEALRQTPIIALTALAMPGDRERCLQAGADAYLSKPVPLKQLVNIIRSHL